MERENRNRRNKDKIGERDGIGILIAVKGRHDWSARLVRRLLPFFVGAPLPPFLSLHFFALVLDFLRRVIWDFAYHIQSHLSKAFRAL